MGSDVIRGIVAQHREHGTNRGGGLLGMAYVQRIHMLLDVVQRLGADILAVRFYVTTQKFGTIAGAASRIVKLLSVSLFKKLLLS